MPADNTPPSSPHNINPHNEEQQHQQQQQQDLSELSPPRPNGHPADQEPHHLQNGQHQEEGQEGEEKVDIKEQEVKKEEEGVEGGGGGDGEEGKEESDGTQSFSSSSSSSSCEDEEKPEFVFVELPDIRKDVQCPICLVFKANCWLVLWPAFIIIRFAMYEILICNAIYYCFNFQQGAKNAQFISLYVTQVMFGLDWIIKKTRTVMECLHRFCRECIDKSMRMGNNECPACRTHCASRRSLRDDPNYDALIAALYPDIDKYEEEELAFHEEEMTRNKQNYSSHFCFRTEPLSKLNMLSLVSACCFGQIQASIAQIIQRQSEALVKRRTMGKESTFMTRTRRTITRRRRNSRSSDFQGSEDIEDENDDNIGKDSSSADERSTEVRHRRPKRRWPSQPSSSAVNSEGGGAENDLDSNRENRGLSPGLAWNTEMLAWGRGGTRSHTRHGNPSGCNNKNSRNTRLSKLVEYLRSLDEKHDELDIHLKLITLGNQSTPSLQQPYLCCRPSLSVKHLCEYVAHQTTLQAEEVELLLIKGKAENLSTKHSQIPMDELQILRGQETVAGLKASCSSSRDHLILAYRQKEIIKS
ncbi:E3 ubiquitin-protein ligase RING1b isoform X1 [Populus alba x Populus x berolinensis]|nr:E3 ubiquitin-protein ligase RING1b isoform X1 [Populus alba x Populus x berolinensis]KAJ6865884.1 E3 ubiquitin-protein ligase RING1b isoform X1 [Populus alba x Populus x berolinensis]